MLGCGSPTAGDLRRALWSIKLRTTIRVNGTCNSLPPQVTEEIELRQKSIPRALQRNFVVPEREYGLLQFRSPLKSLLHEGFDRLFLLGNLLEAHAVCGNDSCSYQSRVVETAGERLLDDLLLIVQSE